MQTILAIEASTQSCSVALSTQDTTIYRTIDQSQQHSAQLLPAVQSVLLELNIKQPDLIAVTIGPGAFTSVRVGTATVQGLALGWSIPVLGISSLAALAMQAYRLRFSDAAQQGIIINAAIDARMGEVYCARYQCSPHAVECISQPQAVPYAYRPTGFAHCFIGNVVQCLDHIDQWGQLTLEATPHALDVLSLARLQLNNGTASLQAPSDLTPVYVRDQVAMTQAQLAQLKPS